RPRGRASRAKSPRHPAEGAAAPALGRQGRGESSAGPGRAAGRLPRRGVGQPLAATLEIRRARRRRGGAENRGGDRRRPPAAAGAGLRRARRVHSRLLGAAHALVRYRAQGRHGRKLQHLPRRAALEDPMPGVDETRPFVPLSFAVLTVSDTRELADDKSGATLVDRIRSAGHKLADRGIVPDEAETIRAQVRRWIADPSIDVVITTGGTGFTGRDVTPEAVEPLFEKRMEGFSAVFHMV